MNDQKEEGWTSGALNKAAEYLKSNGVGSATIGCVLSESLGAPEAGRR